MFGTLSFNTDTDTSIRACDNCRLRKVKVSNRFHRFHVHSHANTVP